MIQFNQEQQGFGQDEAEALWRKIAESPIPLDPEQLETLQVSSLFLYECLLVWGDVGPAYYRKSATSVLPKERDEDDMAGTYP